MSIIGEFIRKKRLERDLSLRELAAISGVSHSYISKIEDDNEDVHPTFDTLEKLATGFNMSIEEFLDKAGLISAEKLKIAESEAKYLASFLQHEPIDFSKLDDSPLTPEELEIVKIVREIDLQPTPEELKGLKAMMKAYLQNLREDK